MTRKSKRFCVYRHFSADGNLLYVGMTNNILRRTSGHVYSASWIDEITLITIEHFSERPEALYAERKAIRVERPVHNHVRKKKRGFKLKLEMSKQLFVWLTEKSASEYRTPTQQLEFLIKTRMQEEK